MIIRERELEIARLEVRLRTPREQPHIERLREALTQRAAEWKATLRSEPKVARLLLRRLIGPLELYDASKPEWQNAARCVFDRAIRLAGVRVRRAGARWAADVRAQVL